ncbi:MAG: hypothetical protein KJ955_06415 [Nanoarchaeota archaeon]|nr:hypothetical protein [Nanoarchaeota archaeon]
MEDSLIGILGGLGVAGGITGALVGYFWVTDSIAKKRAPKLDAEYGHEFKNNYRLMEQALKRNDHWEARARADDIVSLAKDLDWKCFGLYSYYTNNITKVIIHNAKNFGPSMMKLEQIVRIMGR